MTEVASLVRKQQCSSQYPSFSSLQRQSILSSALLWFLLLSIPHHSRTFNVSHRVNSSIPLLSISHYLIPCLQHCSCADYLPNKLHPRRFPPYRSPGFQARCHACRAQTSYRPRYRAQDPRRLVDLPNYWSIGPPRER